MRETNKQKLTILTNTSAGLYLFRYELILKLLSDYDINVLTTDTGRVDELINLGCTVDIINIDKRGTNPINDIVLLFRYLKYIKKHGSNYVINYTIKPNIYGGIACNLLRIPYSNNITGLGTAFEKKGALQRIVEYLYKMGCLHAKRVFFENSDNMKLFIEKRIIKKQQAVLLNGAGVNLEKFSYESYPEKQERVHFLFMGRVMREKGIEELLEAAVRLNDNGYEFSLDVIGSFVDNYQKEFEEYSKESWFNYFGFQNDVRPFISRSHCFVLPSWHEGMANTNLESAAMGRPVITSNIPGCKESVLEGISGFLCEPKNADSLYKSMAAFIELPYEKKRQMGLEGRKHMESCFSKEAVVEKTINELFDKRS